MLADRWQATFSSRPSSRAAPDLVCVLDLASDVPAPPPGAFQFQQGDLIQYYLADGQVTAHFPRFGQLRLDLARGVTEGQLAPAALETSGVLEDMIAIGLSPHLRRRGVFLLHAFGAARAARAILLVGGIGAGKTTTGMALLNAGWKLLSNDSPAIRGGEALSYPGLLAAYPDTLARFPATAHLATQVSRADARQKLAVAAETIWPEVWLERASVAAVLFPHVEPRAEHELELIPQPQALRMLLPHAIEQWDRPMIPAHLAVLSQLVQAAPAYHLRLAPDVSRLPELLTALT